MLGVIARSEATTQSRALRLLRPLRGARNDMRESAELKLGGNKFKVYVTVPPESGRANRAVIELLSKYFGLSASCFEIVRGETARDKIISIKEE